MGQHRAGSGPGQHGTAPRFWKCCLRLPAVQRSVTQELKTTSVTVHTSPLWSLSSHTGPTWIGTCAQKAGASEGGMGHRIKGFRTKMRRQKHGNKKPFFLSPTIKRCSNIVQQ